MADPRDDEHAAQHPQPEGRATRQFDQRHQHQDEGRIFHEIGLGPHAGGESRIATIADQDLAPHPPGDDSQGEP